MNNKLITRLIQQVQLGMCTDRGMKQEAYNNIASAFNASNKYRKKITWQMVKNRSKALKKGYQTVIELLDTSSFGFDNATQHVVAKDQVWDGYVLVSFVNIFIDYLIED